MYTVNAAPASPEALLSWIQEELEKISSIMWELERGVFLANSKAAPDKPRDRQIIYTDGVNWNPGHGKGFYGYYDSAWHFLG